MTAIQQAAHDAVDKERAECAKNGTIMTDGEMMAYTAGYLAHASTSNIQHRCKVVHSESKNAWNIVGTELGGKFKIAQCPYPHSDNDEAAQSAKDEAKEHANFIARCFNGDAAQPQWLPIEQAPKDKPIVAMRNDEGPMVLYWIESHQHWAASGWRYTAIDECPTHFLSSLPALP